MNRNASAFLFGTFGFALAASAATPVASWTPRGDAIGATNVRSDAYGARAVLTSTPAASAPHAGTGTASWSLLGPPGGDVFAVSASPTADGVVLAGIAPGNSFGGTMYRSTDDGASWSPVDDLAGISVHSIAFAPDGTAFVGTQDAVWKSTDDGATWSHITLQGVDPNNDETFAITIDPGNAQNLWIGVTDAAGTQPVNLMRSIDGGATWSDVTPPHDAPMSGAGVAVDPTDSDTVVAVFRGSFGGGEVWATDDGGTTWNDRTDGLPSGNPMNAVAFAGTRVLVGGGQNFGEEYVGLWATDDLGVSWNEIDDATWPLLVVTAIAVDPEDPDTILAATDGTGINRTTDGGATWDVGVGGTGAVATQAVRYAPGDTSTVFAGASSLGVFKSSDGGDTFAQSSAGMAELSLYSIATSPVDPLQIAVAFQGNNNGGVFSSADGGATWVSEPVPPTRYSKVGYSPDGTLYAISSGPSSIAPEGLYRRNGDGTWTGLGPDQGDLYESDLASMRFSENDPNLIFLGGSDFGVAGFAVTIWRSPDAGVTWTKVYAGEDNDFTTDIEIVEDGTDQNLVASYDGFTDPQQGGAFNSTDNGVTWNLANNGLPGFSRIPKLCESAANPGPILMSSVMDDGHATIYRTEDGGASWTSTGWSGDQIADLACDPTNADVLYAAQYSGAPAARSDDGGVTFTDFDAGLASNVGPRALAITSSDTGGARLLMATSKSSYATPIASVLVDPIFKDGFDGSAP
jgi:photosystem II stability/assembly factor-like uncharacterized protein